MQFLADESCDFEIVRELRRAGHDVVAIQEVARGASDNEVAKLAIQAQRVLITEDKDFGQLLWASADSPGVILVRFPSAARRAIAESVRKVTTDHQPHVSRSFIVVEPGRARVSPRI